MKKLFMVIFSISIVLIILSGCTNQTKNLNKCGDGICTLTEDCNNCAKDCGCINNQFCSDNGICKKAVCGDGICSQDEKINNICCEDCGCGNSQICNKINQKCQNSIQLDGNAINKTVNDYLIKNNLTGKIKKIVDAYYKEQTIKEITIDCGTEGLSYPCEIVLFINEKMEILEDRRTS
jgi:hypothetical protein